MKQDKISLEIKLRAKYARGCPFEAYEDVCAHPNECAEEGCCRKIRQLNDQEASHDRDHSRS